MNRDISDPIARQVLVTFVAAYPPYVADRLDSLGLVAPAEMASAEMASAEMASAEMASAVEASKRALHHDLVELLNQLPQQQQRSPLEVFQAALQGPTDVLATAGLPPVERDPVAANALPGDIYDLAPPSSQSLGDAAFEAHVTWGIAKAGAVARMVPVTTESKNVAARRPGVVLVGSDAADFATFEAAVAARGLELSRWRNPGAIEQGLTNVIPLVAFVDVSHRAADEAIRLLTAAEVTTVAFGAAIDDFAMARFGVLGADSVLERTQLLSRLGDYLPRPA